jgi:hypothetical protein
MIASIPPNLKFQGEVFGDLAEKFIEIKSHLDNWHPIYLPLIFLFKDEASEVGAQEIYSRFIELFGRLVWGNINRLSEFFEP